MAASISSSNPNLEAQVLWNRTSVSERKDKAMIGKLVAFWLDLESQRTCGVLMGF